MGAWILSLLERALPTLALSGLIHRLARSRRAFVRGPLISGFLRRFPDALNEAAHSDPGHYETFNALFTRALVPGARPIDNDALLVAPVDGAISQIGHVDDGRIIQAKGQEFTVAELLGEPSGHAGAFANGSFATIYLAPVDYHRIHMPVDATLREAVHFPGRLLSVREASARTVPGLYTRNERVACLFDDATQALAVVMVGAFGVGSISVGSAPGLGRGRRARRHLYRERADARLKKGDELGRFNLGSTVIVLTGGVTAWDPEIRPGSRVLMGQRLA